jgi:hypothetical protein
VEVVGEDEDSFYQSIGGDFWANDTCMFPTTGWCGLGFRVAS